MQQRFFHDSVTVLRLDRLLDLGYTTEPDQMSHQLANVRSLAMDENYVLVLHYEIPYGRRQGLNTATAELIDLFPPALVQHFEEGVLIHNERNSQ